MIRIFVSIITIFFSNSLAGEGTNVFGLGIYDIKFDGSEKNQATEIFETMERKLYNYIMRPAMILSWLFGIILIWINGLESFGYLWLQLKIFFVIVLTIYHEYLGKCMKSLKTKENTKTAKFYRIINEIPTILLILIVFIVIFKPL